MKVALGFDHRGVTLRDAVFAAVRAAGHDAVDCGVATAEKRVDYPDVSASVGSAIRSGRADRGIVVCGSGVGASIAASKLAGIRAAVCHDTFSAHQGVEHDDMNVLCLGSGVVGESVVPELVCAFLGAEFVARGRYLTRLEKVERLEKMTDG